MGKFQELVKEFGNKEEQERADKQTQKARTPRRAKIEIGSSDDVEVRADVENARYLIETPRNYDVYWQFLAKDKAGAKYSEELRTDDLPKNRALFAVPLDKLATNEQIQELHAKVRTARSVSSDVQKCQADIEDVLAFDCIKEGKTVKFVYSTPDKSYCNGPILRVNKYFVAQASGETKDNVFIRVVNTSRFLSGKEFTEREQAVAAKCPVGVIKHIRYEDNGRVSVTDYKPNIQMSKNHVKEVAQTM